jgi:hypothetical protein
MPAEGRVARDEGGRTGGEQAEEPEHDHRGEEPSLERRGERLGAARPASGHVRDAEGSGRDHQGKRERFVAPSRAYARMGSVAVTAV